jgi:hypothetical protein
MKSIFSLLIFALSIFLYVHWFEFDWRVVTVVTLLLWANNIEQSELIKKDILNDITKKIEGSLKKITGEKK